MSARYRLLVAATACLLPVALPFAATAAQGAPDSVTVASLTRMAEAKIGEAQQLLSIRRRCRAFVYDEAQQAALKAVGVTDKVIASAAARPPCAPGAATATPTAAATAGPWRTLIADTNPAKLSMPVEEWNDRHCETKYVVLGYEFGVHDGGGRPCLILYGGALQSHVRIQALLRHIEGPDGYGAGLIFGLKKGGANGTYYYAALDDGGRFKVGHVVDGRETDVVKWTKNANIRSGANSLALDIVDHDVYLYFNGKTDVAYHLDEEITGQTGIFLDKIEKDDDDAEVRFWKFFAYVIPCELASRYPKSPRCIP